MTVSKTLVLFDLDGTLTPPRQPCDPLMLRLLAALRKKVAVGIVSGSDEPKVVQQLGEKTHTLTDFLFVENGTTAYRQGHCICQESLASHLGEQRIKEVVNFVLRYVADLDVPVKRGTFVEYRKGMLNFCPIGRNCSLEERLAFFELDKKEKIRETLVQKLIERFPPEQFGLQFSIGGQISVDCFPMGWDKRLCLRHVEKEFDVIHFFGDKTDPGGNDFEIFDDPRTIGHSVSGPEETSAILKELFHLNEAHN